VFVFVDRWTYRGLHRVPTAVDIRGAHAGTVCWETQKQLMRCQLHHRMITMRLIEVVLAL
jgi:hypothetical protein